MPLNIIEDKPVQLGRLTIADPDTAAWVRSRLEKKRVVPDPASLQLMEETVILGLSQETALARAMAEGFVLLAESGACPHFKPYARRVLESAENGPALATIMARHLAPILKSGHLVLLERFGDTVAALRRHGTYTLTSPLEPISRLLERLGIPAVMAYLSLLLAAFGRDLSYDRCKILVHLIPRAVTGFVDRRCVFQIQAFRRILAFDARLAEPFLTGMEGGVGILKETALNRFVSLGLEKARHHFSKGARFFSLESRVGIETLHALRVSVPLGDVATDLGRYLRARTGVPVAIQSLSERPAPGHTGEAAWVLCDGRTLFLPPEMDAAENREANLRLYKHLAKMEAGLIEFGTFDFDMDRFRQYFSKESDMDGWRPPGATGDEASDLTRFFNGFSNPDLAGELFTIFEHGRLRRWTRDRYPAMWEGLLPTFRDAALAVRDPASLLDRLYGTLALGLPDVAAAETELLTEIRMHFENTLVRLGPVEMSAAMTVWSYPRVAEAIRNSGKDAGHRLHPPFDRRIRPDLFFEAHRAWDTLALRIKNRLAEKNIPVLRSEVRKALKQNNGVLDRDTLTELIQKSGTPEGPGAHPAPVQPDVAALLGEDLAKATVSAADECQADTFWYREWDASMQDYLNRHTRVLERRQPAGETGFYDRVLESRWAMVGRIRHAFELMRPEGLVILRPWMEGDAFDYRALVDAAIDRRIGRIPSERIYIHRLKQQRDVAVLLLVDLSRSTANPAAGSGSSIQSVLEVEKEAMVLFCEALSVLGDRFAVAGFSGNGRLAVEYLRVKDFDEDLCTAVKNRIGSLSPRRSTRMGAAIRHATARLSQVPAKVRLLMVLGDGFPNDTEYQKAHAVADTRRSMAEARSLGIHAHAITVNMAADPQLDDLYGRMHHSVISDVRELPDKLHRIYSRLTR